MKKINVLLLFLALIFSFNIVIAQNTTTTVSKKVYHIKTWHHNKELKADPVKKKEAIKEIKEKFLKNENFSYLLELTSDEYLVVTNFKDMQEKIIHEIFYEYTVKVNTLQTKEIDKTSIDLSTLPKYTNQDITVFNKEIKKWEGDHKDTIENLKSQF
jgi:hypothetical protein